MVSVAQVKYLEYMFCFSSAWISFLCIYYSEIGHILNLALWSKFYSFKNLSFEMDRAHTYI